MCSTLRSMCVCTCVWLCRTTCVCVCVSVCGALTELICIWMYADCCPVKIENEISKSRWTDLLALIFSLAAMAAAPFFDLAWLRNGASGFKAFYTFTVTWLTCIDVTLMHTDTAEIWLNCGSKLRIRPFRPTANSPACQRAVMTMIQWFHKLHIRLTISIGKLLPSRWGVECPMSGVTCRIHLEMWKHWKAQLLTIVVASFN